MDAFKDPHLRAGLNIHAGSVMRQVVAESLQIRRQTNAVALQLTIAAPLEIEAVQDSKLCKPHCAKAMHSAMIIVNVLKAVGTFSAAANRRRAA